MGCIFTRELDSHAPFPGFKGGSRRASRTATARHPRLGWNERAAARVVRQHLVKMVGTPRGRGPIFAAEPPFLGCRGGSRRASRTATARHPYLGWNERAAARVVRQHLS